MGKEDANTKYVINKKIYLKLRKSTFLLLIQAIMFVIAAIYLANTQDFTGHNSLEAFLRDTLAVDSLWAYYLALHIRLFIISIIVIYFPCSVIRYLWPKFSFYVLFPLISVSFYAIFIISLPISGVSFFEMVRLLPMFFAHLFANFILSFLACIVMHKVLKKRLV